MLIGSLAIAAEVLSWRLASLCVDDEFLVGQELVGHVDGCCQVSATVVAKVDTQVLESLLRELCQGDEHLWIGILAEVLDAHVSGLVVEHIGCRDALGRYLASGHGEGLYLLAAVAHHTNLYLGVFLSLESVHGFLVGDNLAYERLAVYRHNLVASQQAGLFGRSVLYHILHVYGVISDHKLDAHTAE